MGGGKERKASQQRQEALSQQQEVLGKFFMDQSKEALGQRKQLQAPVIDYYSKLASGDPSQIMTASAVPLGNLAKMTQQAKANIMEMAPGAARTSALAQLEREAGGQRSTLLNQAYLSAFPALQGLASDSGNVGLQQAGAGYRGTEGAISSNQQIMQMQQQQKASQLGLIGSLAGSAGGIAGGFLGGKGGNGGSRVAPVPGSGFDYALNTAPAIGSAFGFASGGGVPQQGIPIGSGFGLPNTYSGVPNASWYTTPIPSAATNPYIQIPGSPAGYGGSVRPY